MNWMSQTILSDYDIFWSCSKDERNLSFNVSILLCKSSWTHSWCFTFISPGWHLKLGKAFAIIPIHNLLWLIWWLWTWRVWFCWFELYWSSHSYAFAWVWLMMSRSELHWDFCICFPYLFLFYELSGVSCKIWQTKKNTKKTIEVIY